MKRPIVTLWLSLLTVASTTVLAKPEHRPFLNQIRSPELAKALTSPDAFWNFITAPETAYSNRMGAAAQGVNVFPLHWLPRFLATESELAKESRLHGWGLKPHPENSVIVLEPTFDRYLKTGLPREREVLGHRWVVPEKAIPYPMSWEEESLTP
jgi:hypothetical protein